MAEITNPEAIRFVNEIIRPLSESVRGTNVIVDEAAAEWNGQAMNAYFTNGPDTVEDGREAQGVSRATAQDVTDFVGVVADIKAALDAPGAMDIVRKLCVRPLRITEG